MQNIFQSLFKAAALIAFITILGRIAGFLRYLLFGLSVGSAQIGTAYASANLLPNLLFEITAGGALAAMIVPMITGIPKHKTGDELSANQFTSVILNWSLIVCSLLSVLIYFFSSKIAAAIFAGTSNSNLALIQLASEFLKIFALQLPLYAIAIIFGAYLQSSKKFLWPALAPLLSSLTVMAAYLMYAKHTPMNASAENISNLSFQLLAWGTTVGVAVMALSVLLPAFKDGYRYIPSLKLKPQVRQNVFALGTAGFSSVLSQQVVLMLILLLAARAGGVGTLPLFQYGQAVYLLPFAILVMPLITSSLPFLSELRLVGDAKKFSILARTSIQGVIVLSALGASALWGAALAIDSFFEHIDRAAISGVGAVTAALALGLIGYAMVFHTSRLLSAALRAREALLVGSVPWISAMLLILLTNLGAPARTAQNAATLFALCIAAGMGTGLIAALTLLNDRILTSKDMSMVLKSLVIAVIATICGAATGYLTSTLLKVMMDHLMTSVLAALIGASVSVGISLVVMMLFDRRQFKHLLKKITLKLSSPVKFAHE